MGLPAFQHLLDEHGRDVHRLLVASVGPLDADDCYQETWIAALRAYPAVSDASNLRGWLLTIAHRKAIDHVRRGARVAMPAGDAEALESHPAARPLDPGRNEQPTGAGDLGAPSPWPLVRELPPKQRMALALRFALDLDYDEIAAAMGTSHDAARRSVHEGLKRLREEYQR